jgi:hypothetical protein
MFLKNDNNSLFDKKITTQIISLDSRFLNENQKTFMLPEQLKGVISMKVINACIPINWYNVDEHNNKFTIVEKQKDNNAITTNILIPIGHYTRSSICIVIGKLLANNNISLKIRLGLDSKIVFYYTTIDTIDNITITFDETNVGIFNHFIHLGTFLGFTQNTYTVENADIPEKEYHLSPTIPYTINVNPITDEEIFIIFSCTNIVGHMSELSNIFIEVEDYVHNGTRTLINSFSERTRPIITECSCNDNDNDNEHDGHDEGSSILYIKHEYNYLNKNILTQTFCNNNEIVKDNYLYINNDNSILKKRIYTGPVTIDKLLINIKDRYGMNLNKNNGLICNIEIEQII